MGYFAAVTNFKKNMKKILMFALVASIAVFTSCKDEDETFNAPTVVSPQPVTSQISTDLDITFNYTADAGFKSAVVSATNGTAVIKTNGAAGSKSGSVVVTYTSGSQVGAGSVVLTITDNENKTASGTGVISVL